MVCVGARVHSRRGRQPHLVRVGAIGVVALVVVPVSVSRLDVPPPTTFEPPAFGLQVDAQAPIGLSASGTVGSSLSTSSIAGWSLEPWEPGSIRSGRAPRGGARSPGASTGAVASSALEPPARSECGVASWYHTTLGAAHRSLPLGTPVTVTSSDSGRSVSVVINARGPFVPGRILALSDRAFAAIAPLGEGLAAVCIRW
jgi:hypothetical protein